MAGSTIGDQDPKYPHEVTKWIWRSSRGWENANEGLQIKKGTSYKL